MSTENRPEQITDPAKSTVERLEDRVEALEARLADVEFLERALHQTRQRCDRLADTIWDVAQGVARIAFGDDFYDDEADLRQGMRTQDAAVAIEMHDRRRGAWERLGMPEPYELFLATALEPHHFETLDPEWNNHPDHPDASPALASEARLRGARDQLAASAAEDGTVA